MIRATASVMAPAIAPAMFQQRTSKRPIDESSTFPSQRRSKRHCNGSSNVPETAPEPAPETAPETAPESAPTVAPAVFQQHSSKRSKNGSRNVLAIIPETTSANVSSNTPANAPSMAPETDPVTCQQLPSKRYAVCPCHTQDLANIPNQNVEVDYGSCARHCVFCPAVGIKASNIRKHGPICPNSRGVKIRPRKERESIKGHTWCPLTERKELPSSAIESSLNSENGIVDNDPPPVQLIWTPLNPCGSKIDWMRTLVIPFCYTVEELPSKLPWLDRGDLEKIKKELGNQFVVNTKGNEQPDVHQGVVTMQILKHISNCKVDVRAWRKFWKAFVEQDETKVMNSMFRDANGQALNTVILLHWTEEESWVEDEMCRFYMRLERLRAYHGASIRCIPSYAEALQARGKIQDIRALDEDAIKRKQYRPRTCYPGGVCCLPTEEKTVHKRQDSGGRAHVLVKTKGQRGDLTCSVNPTMPMKCMANRPLWFHQEFVDTIERFGEFRAFIVTEPDPKGLRGRKGKIVCIAHTTWRTKDGADMQVELADDRSMHVQLVDDRTFNDINCEHMTRKGLEDYFLRRFEYLRRRDDWREHWASLEIGVRLDAALSPHGAISPVIGEEGFWLVEPTRIYFADFFSDFIHGEPKYRLCEEIAHSIARYLSIQKR